MLIAVSVWIFLKRDTEHQTKKKCLGTMAGTIFIHSNIVKSSYILLTL